MPRTVLFDALAVTTGGQLTRARAFLERFRDHDPGSRLVVLQENGQVQPLSPPSARAEFVDLKNPGPPGYARALRRAAWQNLKIPGLARERAADVYLSFSHALPHRLPARVLTVVGVSNLAPFSPEARAAEVRPSARLRLALLRRRILSATRRADRVIALSETCRDALAAEGIDSSKVAVIPNGVDAPQEVPEAEQSQHLQRLGVSTPFALYVSHFYRYKNFGRLVEAWSRLARQPAGLPDLVLAGVPWDRAYFDEIAALAGRLGIADRVRMIPGVEGAALATLYRRCELFLFPSLIENSPNILLEAMAAGAPVLAGNLAPMPEFGADAVDYFDPLSVESMAAAIGAALADPARRAALRERGRARAGSYSWDAFTRRVVELYR